MKTFADLEFEERRLIGLGLGQQARLDFPNGYGVSVGSGEFYYTNMNQPYEVAVMKDGQLCYDTPITDDVVGYQTEEDVTDIMRRVAELVKED